MQVAHTDPDEAHEAAVEFDLVQERRGRLVHRPGTHGSRRQSGAPGDGVERAEAHFEDDGARRQTVAAHAGHDLVGKAEQGGIQLLPLADVLGERDLRAHRFRPLDARPHGRQAVSVRKPPQCMGRVAEGCREQAEWSVLQQRHGADAERREPLLCGRPYAP